MEISVGGNNNLYSIHANNKSRDCYAEVFIKTAENVGFINIGELAFIEKNKGHTWIFNLPESKESFVKARVNYYPPQIVAADIIATDYVIVENRQ